MQVTTFKLSPVDIVMSGFIVDHVSLHYDQIRTNIILCPWIFKKPKTNKLLVNVILKIGQMVRLYC